MSCFVLFLSCIVYSARQFTRFVQIKHDFLSLVLLIIQAITNVKCPSICINFNVFLDFNVTLPFVFCKADPKLLASAVIDSFVLCDWNGNLQKYIIYHY